MVNPRKLETGLRPNSAEIPYPLLLRIEATGFPTVGLLLYFGLKVVPIQVLSGQVYTIWAHGPLGNSKNQDPCLAHRKSEIRK